MGIVLGFAASIFQLKNSASRRLNAAIALLIFSTRIFQWKNPASLRLRAAKGLLNLSRKENVSQTLSSSTSGLNPLPL